LSIHFLKKVDHVVILAMDIANNFAGCWHLQTIGFFAHDFPSFLADLLNALSRQLSLVHEVVSDSPLFRNAPSLALLIHLINAEHT